MRLAAIYIEDYEYLFDEPQTINFGGEFFYTFENRQGIIEISREDNERFIPGFFNLSDAESIVTNVNTIVGQNGTGKSTILDAIRRGFLTRSHVWRQSKSLMLFEDDAYDYPRFVRVNFGHNQVLLISEDDEIDLVELEADFLPQPIYYAPHYDYKFGSSNSDIDDHNISFDKIVEQDLADIRNVDTNARGFAYSPSQELLFKNSLRQINFLSSSLVSEKEIFKDLFDLPDLPQPVLHFRGYADKEKEWNTPYSFREPLRLIREKVETELNSWDNLLKNQFTDENRDLLVEKFFLKRNVITYILSIIYNQLERSNTFLREAEFPWNELQLTFQNADAAEALIIFASNSTISLRARNRQNVFNNSVELLIKGIYEAIDNIDTSENITRNTLILSKEAAIKLLQLQKDFLYDINFYYLRFQSQELRERATDDDKVFGFIHYSPLGKRMSSGEMALLNLFSRLYDFLDSNLKAIRYRRLKSHYIILLDEADLTFHLSWKKRYIKALLNTLPYFFEELEGSPSVEIILTTHDAITLSDLPNHNVVYIERNHTTNQSDILGLDSPRRPARTFGANISELIADSFFMKDSLTGDFSKDTIHKVIEWLNEDNNFEGHDFYKKIIGIIDEPIVQRKLAQMYDDKMNDAFQENIIDEQIRKLEALKNRLTR